MACIHAHDFACVQVVKLWRLSDEEKQRDGTIEWHGELPDDISHEGYISDGEHCLHAWFAAECFRPAVVAPAIEVRLATADGAAYLVHEKAVVEVIDWWYHHTDTRDTPREWGHVYSGCVAPVYFWRHFNLLRACRDELVIRDVRPIMWHGFQQTTDDILGPVAELGVPVQRWVDHDADAPWRDIFAGARVTAPPLECSDSDAGRVDDWRAQAIARWPERPPFDELRWW